MFLDDIPIDYLGVLVAAIVYFLIGAIWYSPFLFGNQTGRDDQKLETTSDKRRRLYQWSSYLGEFILSYILAYALFLFIQISQADDVIEGITVAFWIWIGFIATTHFSSVLWGRKTLKHFFIHVGFMLIGLLAMGAIIIRFLV